MNRAKHWQRRRGPAAGVLAFLLCAALTAQASKGHHGPPDEPVLGKIKPNADWRIERLGDGAFQTYTTASPHAPDRRFGFAKMHGVCEIDVVWVVWGYRPWPAPKQGIPASIEIRAAGTSYTLAVELILFAHRPPHPSLLVFSKLEANQEFFDRTQATPRLSVKLLSPPELVARFSNPQADFEITGMAKAREQAKAACLAEGVNPWLEGGEEG